MIIFLTINSTKELRISTQEKQIMGIVTDSTPMEEPKDPTHDNVFALYKLMASQEEIKEMSANYLAGNYGYRYAKQALFDLIIQ